MSKIIKLNNLDQIRKLHKGKKIILTHGVFDLVHTGHIDYFNEAKKFGDILVVSVTSNKFVNKGVNRPYFDENSRVKFLSSLSIVDYVVLSNYPSSIKIIQKLKPHYYVKGPDYKISKNDKAGNLSSEKKAIEKIKGQLKYTSGKVLSSTKILNDNYEQFKILPIIKKINNLKTINKKKILHDYQLAKKKIKNEKILIIGEIIIDNYFYSTPLGTPSKENILSVNYLNKKEFIGGAMPVVKTICEYCNNVTFATIYNNKKFKNKIINKSPSKIKHKFFYDYSFKEIKKNRFIDFNTKKKFFEFYEFNNTEFYNKNLNNFLKKNLKLYDKVIVCDFGHGMFNDENIKILEKKSNHLCVNVQTNSGNRGFNLFKKFKRADLLVIDEPEVRLGLSERYLKISDIICHNELSKYKDLVVTRGIKGLLIKNFKTKNKFFNFPALTSNVVDTLGAGDAAYTFASLFNNHTDNKLLVGFLSSIAGALKTQIIGHENYIKSNQVSNSLESLLR